MLGLRLYVGANTNSKRGLTASQNTDGLEVVDLPVVDDDLHETVGLRGGNGEEEADEVGPTAALSDEVDDLDDLLGSEVDGVE